MTDNSPAKQPKRPPSGEQLGNGKGLDGETRKHIGRWVKAAYDEVAHEPIPDKFHELLKQLEAAEPRKQ